MLLRLEVQVTPPPSFIRYEVPNDRLPKLLRRPSIRQLGSPSCQYDFALLLTSLVEFQTARQGARQQRLTHIPHDPLVPPHHTAKYAPAQPSPGSSNHLTRISPLLVFELVRAAAVTRPSEPMMRGLSYLTGSLSSAEHDILHEAIWPWRKRGIQCVVLEIDALLSHPPLFSFSSSSARANRETCIDSAGTLLELFTT